MIQPYFALDQDQFIEMQTADDELRQRAEHAETEVKRLRKALIAQDIAEANDRGEDIFPRMRAIDEVDLYESGDDLHEWAAKLRRSALSTNQERAQ